LAAAEALAEQPGGARNLAPLADALPFRKRFLVHVLGLFDERLDVGANSTTNVWTLFRVFESKPAIVSTCHH